MKSNQFPEDAGPLAHPVRPETYHEINNFYTATVYEKGAELVRMIATLLGEKKFRSGMNKYLKRHDGDAATIEQFITCFEQAAKTDLQQFMRWYSQAGTPQIQVTSGFDKAKSRFTMEVEQAIPDTPNQKRKAPHLIPLRLGLLAGDGSEIKPAKISGADYEGDVVHLTKRRHKLVFDGITEKPVVSLNRSFSAPVDIHYRQTTRELLFLAANDSDSFGRWQAMQTCAGRLLIKAAQAFRKNEKPSADAAFIEVLHDLVTDETLEPAYRASLITLPSEADVAQLIAKNVNPLSIRSAHELYTHAIGKYFEESRPSLIKQMSSKEMFSPDAESAGKRSLVSVLNHYGVAAGMAKAETDTVKLYKSADNLTDRFNAFVTIIHVHKSKDVRETILADFYKRYRSNYIVLDKWFSVQASRPGNATSATVRKLMKHEDFSMTNPNRMRALLGVFAMANQTGFNASNGSGYDLLAKAIIQLDMINPQVAARLLTAFRSYRVLEPARRKLAEKALRLIAGQEVLSPDVADIVRRTLA